MSLNGDALLLQSNHRGSAAALQRAAAAADAFITNVLLLSEAVALVACVRGFVACLQKPSSYRRSRQSLPPHHSPTLPSTHCLILP